MITKLDNFWHFSTIRDWFPPRPILVWIILIVYFNRKKTIFLPEPLEVRNWSRSLWFTKWSLFLYLFCLLLHFFCMFPYFFCYSHFCILVLFSVRFQFVLFPSISICSLQDKIVSLILDTAGIFELHFQKSMLIFLWKWWHSKHAECKTWPPCSPFTDHYPSSYLSRLIAGGFGHALVRQVQLINEFAQNSPRDFLSPRRCIVFSPRLDRFFQAKT